LQAEIENILQSWLDINKMHSMNVAISWKRVTRNFQGRKSQNKTNCIWVHVLHYRCVVAKQNFELITLSWLVRKNACIPCNGAPTGNRKSSSAQEGKHYEIFRNYVKCEYI
jgi:hypothetical protein